MVRRSVALLMVLACTGCGMNPHSEGDDMRVEKILTELAGHRHPMVTIEYVVLAARCARLTASTELQLVDLDWWQRFARAHGFADTIETLGHRPASAVEEVAAQCLPAADAADDRLHWNAAQSAIDRAPDAA